MAAEITDEGSEPTPVDVPTPVDLVALALSAQAGEPGAFDILATHIAGRLAAFARQTLFDRQLAEEAVQESLLRIYRFLPSFGGGSFLAWALTIGHRVCTDLLRRERRQQPALSLAAAPIDPMEASDVRTVVEQALGELPVNLRTVFVLRQQGLSYADIAQIVETPVGTVRSRLFAKRGGSSESNWPEPSSGKRTHENVSFSSRNLVGVHRWRSLAG